jgi:hypothetical protein
MLSGQLFLGYVEGVGGVERGCFVGCFFGIFGIFEEKTRRKF